MAMSKWVRTLNRGLLAWVLILIGCCGLGSCVSGIWTGASLFYDRHNVYKSVNDFTLSAKIQHAIYEDKKFNRRDGKIFVAVFHKRVLLAGHIANEDLKREALDRVRQIKGYKQLYDFVVVESAPIDNMTDQWISTKIKSKVILNDSIDPNAFKIVVVDRVVYLMGDVKRSQAEQVVAIARQVDGVEKVVKLMRYFTFQKQATSAGTQTSRQEQAATSTQTDGSLETPLVANG